ncbi:efflux RND transporter periplasmic adaptor subunit [Rubellimicrobium arenae]|uniref:efflux RND transporter periplasmic adaptor subunit n=1 Tax=Rubellimicrobium arenae TaxID=2817372 RepID=UPI001B30C1EC|nr:efflux RND transporter periplasmic adaptor subunit [Rubellimicrobium arenae]
MSVIGRTIGLAAAALLGCGGAAVSAQDAPPPPAVTVVTLQPQTVTLTSTLPGRVVPSASAEVRPQVAGIITERRFQEGSRVEAGDVLYTIDPTTYQAALAQAEASVAQAQAQLGAAQREAGRVQELAARAVASQQVVDEATAARDAAEAALQVAQAQQLSARIELERTTIKAPISGEIGLSLTSQGALVTASQADPLTVIRQIDPVYVDVTQSAAELLAWRRGQAEADLGTADRTVRLILADGTEFEHTGELTAAEPHVDEQTGVVVLRMEFPNPELLLLPGMYVQVEMPTGTADDVFLIPQEGVSRDRRGRPTAWVVNADNVVEERQLTVLEDRGSDWVVSEGLEAGSRVIVAGLQKTAPGATVAPEEQQPPADAAAEATPTAESELASGEAAAD